MATKPTRLPRWATDPTYPSGHPYAGELTKVEPDSDKKDVGHEPGEKPPAEYQNDWQNLVYLWAEYLDDLIFSESDLVLNREGAAVDAIVRTRSDDGESSFSDYWGDGSRRARAGYLAPGAPGVSVAGAYLWNDIASRSLQLLDSGEINLGPIGISAADAVTIQGLQLDAGSAVFGADVTVDRSQDGVDGILAVKAGETGGQLESALYELWAGDPGTLRGAVTYRGAADGFTSPRVELENAQTGASVELRDDGSMYLRSGVAPGSGRDLVIQGYDRFFDPAGNVFLDAQASNVYDDIANDEFPYVRIHADGFHTYGQGPGQMWIEGPAIDANSVMEFGRGKAGQGEGAGAVQDAIFGRDVTAERDLSVTRYLDVGDQIDINTGLRISGSPVNPDWTVEIDPRTGAGAVISSAFYFDTTLPGVGRWGFEDGPYVNNDRIWHAGLVDRTVQQVDAGSTPVPIASGNTLIATFSPSLDGDWHYIIEINVRFNVDAVGGGEVDFLVELNSTTVITRKLEMDLNGQDVQLTVPILYTPTGLVTSDTIDVYGLGISTGSGDITVESTRVRGIHMVLN